MITLSALVLHADIIFDNHYFFCFMISAFSCEIGQYCCIIFTLPHILTHDEILMRWFAYNGLDTSARDTHVTYD